MQYAIRICTGLLVQFSNIVVDVPNPDVPKPDAVLISKIWFQTLFGIQNLDFSHLGRPGRFAILEVQISGKRDLPLQRGQKPDLSGFQTLTVVDSCPYL